MHRYDFDGRYAYVSSTKKGYVEQHRRHPRSQKSFKTPGSVPLVDSGTMEGWRRRVSVEGFRRTTLSSSAAGGRQTECQLLAPRHVHSGYFRHLEAEDGIRASSQPGVSPSDLHLSLHPDAAQRAQGDGRRDEDVAALRPSAPAFAWVYDITDEKLPTPIATINVPGSTRTAHFSRR